MEDFKPYICAVNYSMSENIYIFRYYNNKLRNYQVIKLTNLDGFNIGFKLLLSERKRRKPNKNIK